MKRKFVRRVLIGTIVGLTALVATCGVWQASTWPDVASLRSTPPTTTAFIERYRARQRQAGASDAVHWQWVALENISPHLQRAVVAAEDMEFFSHEGFSTSEMQVAIREAVREGTAPRGASTITQQLAKNLWLSPSRNPLRKLKEAMLTRQLEKALPKDRILEIYVNVVEFGRGIYGAEAAAWRYFDRPASNLDAHESAMLAASLPRPNSWHPGVTSAAYAQYVEDIEGRVERATFLERRIPDTR